MNLSDRYLSSKIDHNVGEWSGMKFENYTLVINFLVGEGDSTYRKTFKQEFATRKEAKEMEGNALSIIKENL